MLKCTEFVRCYFLCEKKIVPLHVKFCFIMKDLLLLLRNKLVHLLSLNEDAADQELVVEGIRSGVEFRGAKLWILIFAIFVASLGLNTNSAAVIIGAMLISPLMGPIIGMGMGLGIYDFDLLKRSVRNYLIATLFSVLTATVYFLITPFSEAQSELLARTSPTIYDVLIALCGGLAGIIALGSKSQRTGNVIPGVAIATALMPPLCTVGFGIATANWHYALGAMYLFVINTIFIASATFVGARWIMRFTLVSNMDKAREKRTRIFMTILIVCTIIPSIILTINMVRESYFNRDVNRFIAAELHWPKTQVISHKVDFSSRSFDVVLIGAEVDSVSLAQANDRLQYYGLQGVNMHVMQTAFGIDEEEFKTMLTANNSELRHDEAIIAQQQADILELQRQLAPYQYIDQLTPDLYLELKALYPEVQSIRLARGLMAENGALEHKTVLTIYSTRDYKEAELERIEAWITQRAEIENLVVVTKKAVK